MVKQVDKSPNKKKSEDPQLELRRLLAELAEADSQAGFLGYLRHVVIDARPDPLPFADAARPWQWEWCAKIAPVLESACGLSDVTRLVGGPRCFWRTLARGHDKTTGLARAINYALAFGRRPVQIDHAAADWDQAALLLAAMRKECELNPWLGRRIQLDKKRARGPGGELYVMTADAPSAAGRIPDIITVDEPTHWRSRDLWDMLWSSVNKRPQTLVFVITNAGVKESWQWDVKEAAKQSPTRWSVYEAPGRLASWMSEENIAEDRKLLAPAEARRLLDNEWIDPAEEAGYLAASDVTACDDLGRELGLVYNTVGKRGVEYWASIDYGPRRDRTALAVVHQRDSGLIVPDRLDVWQGSRVEEIQIAQIRSWLHEARQQFVGLNLIVDPYQLKELVQDFRGHMHVEEFESRGGKSNYEMAELLRSLIINKQIAWYPGAGSLVVAGGKTETLVDELKSLVIKRTSYGYRIDHESTKHDDRAVAVGMACVKIMERQPSRRFERPPQVAAPLQSPLRVRRISAERRGLYGMSENP